MPKISRTYRLSEEALQMIEGRDKRHYPTANEYVEKMILKAGGAESPEQNETLLEIKIAREEIKEMHRLMERIYQENSIPEME